jgi:dolichol-phosphate mannosyltransferase
MINVQTSVRKKPSFIENWKMKIENCSHATISLVLSLILPTYNEAQNLPILLPKIEDALQDIPHEVIIVDDDSPDKTWHVAHELSQRFADLRVIRRIGRRGLSSAVVEGFLSANGDTFVVMDADGQHDLFLVPRLYDAVQSGAHIALGSRYAEGGSVGMWDERRYTLSRIATRLAILLCKVNVRDPMSGFFAIDRETFEETLPRLNPKGFKILLDLLIHIPKGTTVREIPFMFGKRLHGESKLSRRVQLEFLEYLYDVTLGRFIPLTFVKYCIVGTLGILVNLGAYEGIRFLLAEAAPSLFGFSLSVLGAIEIAIIFNFLLNNIWTFSHARLHGLRALWGFLTFNAACAIGAVANYGVSAFLFSRGWHDLASVSVGAFVGIFWNYTMNRLMTWRE